MSYGELKPLTHEAQSSSASRVPSPTRSSSPPEPAIVGVESAAPRSISSEPPVLTEPPRWPNIANGTKKWGRSIICSLVGPVLYTTNRSPTGRISTHAPTPPRGFFTQGRAVFLGAPTPLREPQQGTIHESVTPTMETNPCTFSLSS